MNVFEEREGKRKRERGEERERAKEGKRERKTTIEKRMREQNERMREQERDTERERERKRERALSISFSLPPPIHALQLALSLHSCPARLFRKFILKCDWHFARCPQACTLSLLYLRSVCYVCEYVSKLVRVYSRTTHERALD